MQEALTTARVKARNPISKYYCHYCMDYKKANKELTESVESLERQISDYEKWWQTVEDREAIKMEGHPPSTLPIEELYPIAQIEPK